MSANPVAERADTAPANVAMHPASDSGSLLQIISRAASDPAVDIDKMERLMAMYERQTSLHARAAYYSALAEMQPEIPVVERHGKITIHKKDAAKTAENVIQSTPYALWEDINDAIRPVMSKHGFALSFRVKKEADRVEVTGVLSHREGHFEETTLSLPMDSTGSKNNVQAIGSSISYAKRYTAGGLLNITSRGEDDDGRAAGASADETPRITDEQRDELIRLLEEAGTTTEQFCHIAKIDALPDLPVDKLGRVKTWIANRKAAIEKQKASNPKATLDRQFGGNDAN